MEYFSRREGDKEMSSKYITSCIAYSMIAAWVVEFRPLIIVTIRKFSYSEQSLNRNYQQSISHVMIVNHVTALRRRI